MGWFCHQRVLQKTKECQTELNSWCIICGFNGSNNEVRKHQFVSHYKYFRSQCNGDPEYIKSIMVNNN